MHIDLSDEQAELLLGELDHLIDGDRCRRILALREIRAMIKPYPVSEPLPPRKVYAPPTKGRYHRRRQTFLTFGGAASFHSEPVTHREPEKEQQD